MVDVFGKGADASAWQKTPQGLLRCAAKAGKGRAGARTKGTVTRPPSVAGVMAAKRTEELIPLCIQLP